MSKLLRKKNMLFYEERGKIGTFSFTFQQRVRKENEMLENARIQTFPDDWEFQGTIGAKYRQVGNAVPCNLAKEIGLECIKTLEML